MAGSLPSESDEHEDGGGGGGGVMVRQTPVVKKRFRTKFTQEQKEKMLSFAEKVGWKIQKQEESVVQQFCQEVGVKRRVLKVWMHNNKHNLAKKNLNHSNPQNQV
ncbi:UNVERIFIED_CONTAM: Zinc-finger homeodomain protein 3 [Sesamum angustifolium]|uniref:Zinc-finger homeodomain protein 3 n=1 Tax=Sesamum angustifolium TaxID=2727405 RepID=A0AAW2QC95_9LAMI